MNRFIVLLLFSLFSLSISFDSNFERSQYPLRSGDLIIVPDDIQDDSFLFVFDSNKVEQSKNGFQIEETSFVNLVSSMIGGPIINTAFSLDENVVPTSHNLFNKAKGNFAIFVNSIGSDVISSFPSLKILQQPGQQLKIKKVAYPEDTIATITTIMTGQTPSTHGIVNKEWNAQQSGAKVAYSSDAQVKIFNMNDQFTQSFEAQPLIISASSNFQMASALGVNSRNNFGNNYAIYWNEEIADFDNIYNSYHRFNYSYASLVKKFKSDVSLSEFDVNLPEDFYFLAEIEFLQNMIKVIENDKILLSLINDKVPDFFSFSFASLKNLKAKNDVGSTKFAVAINLLDSTLLDVITKLNSLYSEKLAVEIFFLGTPAAEKLSEDVPLKATVFSALKGSVNKALFDAYFPSIYLKKVKDQEGICHRVREEILNEVICTDHKSHVPSLSELVRATQSTSTEVGDTPLDTATTFQTVLWVSIILVLAVIASVYAVFAIQVNDSMLYRATPKQHHQ